MVLDIILVLILITSLAYGFKKGCVFTLIHTVGWAIALVLSLLAMPVAKEFLKKSSGLYDWFHAGITTRFDISIENLETSMDSVPKVISPSISNFSTDLVNGVVESFANVIFTIFVFIVVFFIIKLILWLILRIFSKDYTHGFVNFFDGLLGAILGIIRGGFIVLLFVTLLLPVANILSVDTTSSIVSQLNDSLIAQSIYDQNVVLILLQNFF